MKDSNRYRFNGKEDDTPPLFKALGIPDVDNGAAELGYCRTLIKAHLNKVKSGTIDSESLLVLFGIRDDLVSAIRHLEILDD